MRYTSAVTPKGNSSYTSQADADAKAAALDANGCTGCSRCTDCSLCTGCSYCSRCTDCSRCSDCSGDVIQAGQPNSWPCYGWLKDGKLAIHCGCHVGERAKTFESAVEYWSGKTARAEVLAACHYIAEIAKQRGWAL